MIKTKETYLGSACLKAKVVHQWIIQPEALFLNCITKALPLLALFDVTTEINI